MRTESGVTYVVRARSGREILTRDLLYALAGQVHPQTRAIVLADDGAAATGHLAGLLTVRMLSIAPTSTEGARAFQEVLPEIVTPFCAFLEDFDVPYPRHAALLVRALEKTSAAVLAFGDGYRVEGSLTASGYVSHKKTRWSLETPDLSPALPHGAALVRTEAAAMLLDEAGQVALAGRLTHLGATPVFERRIGIAARRPSR